MLVKMIVVSLMALLFAGCSTTGGYMGHAVLTEVQLSQANYTVIKTVTGTSSADYFFGIGPSDQDLIGQAKRDLLNKAQLSGSQAIINVTTDIKHTSFLGYLVWYQKVAYVTAEVIQFN